jgi:hypothetical protein
VLQRDTRGNLRPVAYYSRRLSPSEVKYSTYQREFPAIRDCLLAFRFYLVGLPFICKTDHYSLQWLTEQAEMSPLHSRWYTVFLEYHIKEIQYVKGEKNALADALSRDPDPSSQSIDHLVPPFNMDVTRFHGLGASVDGTGRGDIRELPTPRDLFGTGALVQPIAPPDCSILQNWQQHPGISKPSSVSVTLDDWRAAGYNVSTVRPSFLTSFHEAYSSCPEFGPVWAALANGTPGRDVYPDFFLDVEPGLLFLHVVGGDGVTDKYRICVPTMARQEVLKEMHDAVVGPFRHGQDVHSGSAGLHVEVLEARRGYVCGNLRVLSTQQGVHSSCPRHPHTSRCTRRQVAGSGSRLGVLGRVGRGL